jgi:hypothetical protein
MPKQYEAVRDSYESRGVPAKRAKTLAAMTYNAHRGPDTPPVTRASDRSKRLDRWATGKRKTTGEK